MAVVAQFTEILRKVLQMIWKIATLQFLIEFIVSNPLRSLVYLPVVGPLALVLSLITVCTVGGIVFIASGLLLLIATPLSGPLAFMALILCLCYIVYKACLAVINYLYEKIHTLYEKASHKFYGAFELIKSTRITVQTLRDLRDKLNVYIQPRTAFDGMRQKYSIFQARCLQLLAMLLLRLQQWKRFFLHALALRIDKVERARKCKQVETNSAPQKRNLSKGEDAPTRSSVKRCMKKNN